LGFVFEVIKDLLDHLRVFDTGDHLHRPGAFPAGLDIDVENTLEPLCPCHRRSAGVGGSSPTHALHPLPRFGGVTSARCLQFGASTPWKRVKFTLGLGTRLASLAMKSSGSKITWRGAVPVRRLQPVTDVAIGGGSAERCIFNIGAPSALRW